MPCAPTTALVNATIELLEEQPAVRALIDSSVQGEITNYLLDILAEVIEPELRRVLGAAAQS